MVNDGTPFDMIDGGDYDADKAYKDSKVCFDIFYEMIGYGDVSINERWISHVANACDHSFVMYCLQENFNVD